MRSFLDGPQETQMKVNGRGFPSPWPPAIYAMSRLGYSTIAASVIHELVLLVSIWIVARYFAMEPSIPYKARHVSQFF